MTAEITNTAIGWVVVCEDPDCPRPLRWTCGSEQHAINLAAKHDREHHPDAARTVPGEDPAPVASYNVSAAARAYLAAVRTGRTASRGGLAGTQVRQALAAATAAEEVWHALTGLTGQGAMDAAEHAANHVITAHAAPF